MAWRLAAVSCRAGYHSGLRLRPQWSHGSLRAVFDHQDHMHHASSWCSCYSNSCLCPPSSIPASLSNYHHPMFTHVSCSTTHNATKHKTYSVKGLVLRRGLVDAHDPMERAPIEVAHFIRRNKIMFGSFYVQLPGLQFLETLRIHSVVFSLTLNY